MVNRLYEEPQPGRITVARIAAPLGFFVAVTALVLVVHSSLSAPSKPERKTSTSAVTGLSGTSGAAEKKSKKTRYYRVRAGDTLDAIAIRFHTNVDTLLQLNPKVDQYNLSPGERVRVR